MSEAVSHVGDHADDGGMGAPATGDQGGSGDADTSDESTRPGATAGDETGETPEAQLSYADDIQPIFDAHCVRCHSPGGLADLVGVRLKLRPGESWNLLVNQASSQRSDLTLVVPENPDASLLYQKVSKSDPPVGSRMPLGGPVLSADEIERIRVWIDAGALNN